MLIKQNDVANFNVEKATKHQRYAMLKTKQLPLFSATILARCATHFELASEIKEMADKFECIKSQLHHSEQWYLGVKYKYTAAYVESALQQVNNLASELRYDLIKLGGSHFLMNKKTK